MKKLLIVGLVLLLIMVTSPAFARGFDRDNPCDGFMGKLLNQCLEVHDHDSPQAGIGADVLIHETEHADIVAEYKVDFNNDNDQSIYGVVRTKTSVVELVKKLIKKIKKTGE